jgi:glycosyltransferase involved in cell wall biosynthesis
MSQAPGFLVLDTSYTFEMIRERGLEDSVRCRDLDGFFRHVWSVHPFATLLTSETWTPRYGKPVSYHFDPRHTFIEGKVGRLAWLRRIFPLNFLLAQAGLFFRLARLIRRENIRVIRVGDPLFLGLFGLGLARLTGAKLAIRVNGNNDKIRATHGRPLFPRLFGSIRVEKAVERFVFRRADLVAAPNQDNVDFAVANGARPDRVTIFRYGNLVAREHLSDPATRPLTPETAARLGIETGRYLLCMGRLEAVKFPDDAVRVLGEAAKVDPDIKLVLAGDGQMRIALADLARELGVAANLVFAGNQNQVQLAELIPNAAVVISPLTGRSLTEAAFGRVPIVAYDLDWQGELIETGVTGELVPFRDCAGLARATIRLIEDRDYARRMAEGVRERARRMLDPAALNEHERSEYRKLLGEGRPLRP